MNANEKPKLPSSITNPKLRALYLAAQNELDRIRDEVKNALIYAINNAYNMPVPDALPFLARDLDVHGLEYLAAQNTDGTGVYTKQREVTQKSFELHKKKGTAGIIHEVCQLTGRTDIDIQEWFDFDGGPGAPFTYKIDVQLPVNDYENSVIFGLINEYKRFVMRQIGSYFTKLYKWCPAPMLTVGKYVDFRVTQVEFPDEYDDGLGFSRATGEVIVSGGHQGAVYFSRATGEVIVTQSE